MKHGPDIFGSIVPGLPLRFGIKPVVAEAPPAGFTVQTATYGGEPPSSETHVVPLPAGSGGRLLVLFASAYTNTFTDPAGWTRVITIPNFTTPRVELYIIERDASGFSDETVTVTMSSARYATAISMRVSGAAGAPSVGTGVTGLSAAPNPPSLSPPGGSAPYLWIPAAGCSAPQASPTYPTGYTNTLTATDVFNGGTTSRTLAAWKEATAATEDPDPFGVSTDTAWASTTLAYAAA